MKLYVEQHCKFTVEDDESWKLEHEFFRDSMEENLSIILLGVNYRVLML